MTRYNSLGISSDQIAGAIAEIVIHDLRENRSSLAGFPQIGISSNKDYLFTVLLSWRDFSVEIELSKSEAKGAAEKFKSKEGFDEVLFDRVQEAFAALELKVRSGRNQAAVEGIQLGKAVKIGAK